MKKTIILPNGKKHNVIKETDRYYICKNAQFRKSNRIITVKEDPVKEEQAAEEVVISIPEVEPFDIVNTDSEEPDEVKKEETEEEQKGE